MTSDGAHAVITEVSIALVQQDGYAINVGLNGVEKITTMTTRRSHTNTHNTLNWTMNVNKSIRVFLTEGCNANCSNCFNKKARGDNELSLESFSQLCQYLDDSGFTSLKIMGGEPTTHSKFSSMIDIAQKNFSAISVFTNGLNSEVLSVNPRKRDVIVYNMNFEEFLTEEKLLLNKPGKRTLKFQVNETTNIAILESKIRKWTSLKPDIIKTSFTFDCTSNIFKYRELLTEKIAELELFMHINNLAYGFDHKVPKCFFKDASVKITYPSGLCRIETAGLIDSNLNVRYCNQHNEIVCSLLRSDGLFVPWGIIKNKLIAYYYKNQLTVLESECGDCKLYGEFCNGGCWGQFISKESFK